METTPLRVSTKAVDPYRRVTKHSIGKDETLRTDPDSNAFLRIILRLEKDIYQGSQPL
jgi:hypothetical protein